MSDELGYGRLRSGIATAELMLDWATGRWDGLEERARAVSDEMAHVPHDWVDSELVLALLALARGRLDEARDGFNGMIDVASRAGSIPTFASASAGMSRLLLGQGDAEAAAERATQAMDVVAAKGVWVWAAPVAPVAVEALIACGRTGDAARWAERFAAGVIDRDAPLAHAASTWCRALVEAGTDVDAAGTSFERAATMFDRLPAPYLAAQVREQHGRWLLDDQREAATAHLLSAVEAYRSLGAAWDDARVRQTLRDNDVALPYPLRGGRRSYGNELSPREQEVAELAAAGLTNAQIAQQLFLSQRTIAHHLERVMRKLGLTSRRDLADHPGRRSPPPANQE